MVSAAGGESLIELKSGRDPLQYLSVFTDQNVGEMNWRASGVMIEPGLAVTNAHVVLPGYDEPMPDDIMIAGQGGLHDTEFPVEQMLVEASRDLAFLRIPQDQIQGGVQFADIAGMQLGMPLIHGGAQERGERTDLIPGEFIEQWQGRLFTDRVIASGMSGGMSDSELIDPQRRLLGINYADYVGRFRGGQVGVGVSGDIIQEIMQSPDFADRFMDVGSYFAARNANQIGDDMAAARGYLGQATMYLMDRLEEIGTRYAEPELMSGRNERDIVAELLGRAGVPREPQR